MNEEIINSSDDLVALRTYGFLVRERVEAYGSLMPEWMVTSMVEESAKLEGAAVSYLQDNLVWSMLGSELGDYELKIALEFISILGKPISEFHDFLKSICESLDLGDESDL